MTRRLHRLCPLLLRVLCTACVLLLAGAPVRAATARADAEALPPAPVLTIRRFALVVGANDGGHDRPVLRFANSDARAMGAVLQGFGGVSQADLQVLQDPTPAELMEAIDAMSDRIRRARRGQHVQFVFYYSGHSDEQGLLLEGERVTYKDLRHKVQSVPADVRIAVLDSCASGAFTRTKGGTKRAPFLVSPAAEVKGHAFLTSSSMDEAAQESDRVGGSFFTHYFTTGLRGAADVDGD
ncbi:MAG: caspase family protein, partial [Myxococcales bacterium]|nr:caspase family protein [Myxococcales bacterium]